MASFIPIISEILPMIIPASTHITTAKELEPAQDTADSPFQQTAAVVNRCDKMCASVLTTRPKCSSPIRHNSEQVSGSGSLTVKEGFEDNLRQHQLRPGDFAFIPAWTEHQVTNDSELQDLVLVITQSGSEPVGAVLTDWGGDEAVTTPKAPTEERRI